MIRGRSFGGLCVSMSLCLAMSIISLLFKIFFSFRSADRPCQSGLAASKDQHAFDLQSPRYGWLAQDSCHWLTFLPISNVSFLQLAINCRPLCAAAALKQFPARTTQCIQRRETLCGTRWYRGEIAFRAGRQANGVRMPLLWTVVVIVWFIWKLETAMSWPRWPRWAT